MADNSENFTAKNEPVNLLYLATTKGTDCEEIRQHEKELSSTSNSAIGNDSNDDTSSSNEFEQDTVTEKNSSEPQASKHRKHRPSIPAKDDVKERGTKTVIQLDCPRVSCPEKIIICLDISSDMEKQTFRSRVGDKFSPIQLVKRALGLFMLSKHRINPRHEFALVFLQDAAFWISDFTKNPSKIITILDDLSSCTPTESFDLSSVFNLVYQNVVFPTVPNPKILPPPYIVRTVILYGRSNCIPKMESTESLKLLYNSAYFFLDAFYIHEPPSDNNQCEAIFDKLCELDITGLSYISEVSRNPTKLYDGMAQLLPHPLQRPLQRDAKFNIEEEQHQANTVPES